MEILSMPKAGKTAILSGRRYAKSKPEARGRAWGGGRNGVNKNRKNLVLCKYTYPDKCPSPQQEGDNRCDKRVKAKGNCDFT